MLRETGQCALSPCELDGGSRHQLLTSYSAVIKTETAIQVFVETRALASLGPRGYFGLALFWMGFVQWSPRRRSRWEQGNV